MLGKRAEILGGVVLIGIGVQNPLDAFSDWRLRCQRMKVEIRLAAKSGAGSQLFPRAVNGARGQMASFATVLQPTASAVTACDKQGGYSAAM